MKKISTIFALLCAVLLLVKPGASRAQTITLDSVSATSFCAGDPVSITFTATGTWLHTNAFSLQLSDTEGSFLTPDLRNLGSLLDTVSGTFTIISTIPLDALHSSHSRFRVMAAKPYTVSADNGTDVSIGQTPGLLSLLGPNGNTGLVNSPISFVMNNFLERNVSLYWDFGENSDPSTVAGGVNGYYQTTTYSTGGLKTIILRAVAPGGCSTADTTYVNILDCTDPVVPHDAVVVNADQDLAKRFVIRDTVKHDSTISPDLRIQRSVWVNPGVSVSGGMYDTIFAEAGATVTDGSYNIVYLKPGAVYLGTGSLVIYADGAGVSQDATKLSCSSLTFDYSHAPPNSIMHINEAVQNTSLDLAPVELSPNPTSGMLTLRGAPTNVHVQVMNALGEAVREIAKTADSNVSLDLSKLPSGTYYVRLTSNGGTQTKKVVKE